MTLTTGVYSHRYNQFLLYLVVVTYSVALVNMQVNLNLFETYDSNCDLLNRIKLAFNKRNSRFCATQDDGRLHLSETFS